MLRKWWSKVKLWKHIHIKHWYAFKGEFFSDVWDYILLSPWNFSKKDGLKLKWKKEKYYLWEFPKEYILNIGDLLIAMTDLKQSAPYLWAPWLVNKKNMLHNQRLWLVTIDSNKLNRKYLYHFLNSEYYRWQIRSSATGSTVKHTAPDRIYNIDFILPPLKTQKRIASILSNYDDLIENNTHRIRILEEQAQALYRQWFVEFKFPWYEKVEMIESGSDFGLIPEGWKVKKLDDACDLLMGQSPKSEYYNNEWNWLPFHQGVTNFWTIFPTHTKYCTYDKWRIANEWDILLSVRAPVWRINIANDILMIWRWLCSIRDNNNYQSFILQQLKSIFYAEDIMGWWSIFQSVTKWDMQNIELLYPSIKVIEDFENIASKIDMEIVNLSKQNVSLKKQRDILLPRLVSWEILVD